MNDDSNKVGQDNNLDNGNNSVVNDVTNNSTISDDVNSNVNDMVDSSQASNESNNEVVNTGDNGNSNDSNIQNVSSENGTIEEVSIKAESLNDLDASEISENSVFNKPEVESENKIKGIKEGQEELMEKKGSSIPMLIVFVLVIICAFSIDYIVEFFEERKANKNSGEVVEEVPGEVDNDVSNSDSNTDIKTLSLEEIKGALDSSSAIDSYEATNNIVLDVSVNEDNIIFTTSNYLNVEGLENLSVTYKYENNVLTATCDRNNSEFGKVITIYLIKEIASLQGVVSDKIDSYIEENLYTNKIDSGFELTNVVDGENIYKVKINYKLNI